MQFFPVPVPVPIPVPIPVDFVPFYPVREFPHPQAGDAGIIVGYGLSSYTAQNSSGVHRWGNTALLQVFA